jgi:hypothetical protein
MMTPAATNTDYSGLVARYKGLRRIVWRLQNDVLPKYLSKQAMQTSGEKLGIMERGTLVFETEDEIGVLMDHSLYDYWDQGANTILRHIVAAPPDPGTEEYAVLKAMVHSFHTVVQVTKTLPGIGVRVVDLLAGRQEYLLIDLGFGQTARQGVMLATRLLPLDDFVMTSGAALLVDGDTWHEIRDSVLPKYGIDEEGRCSLSGGRDKAAARTAAIIRLCLSSESAGGVEYQDVREEPNIIPLKEGVRAGRNEPCPCGSGRKFKHCCGRDT